MRREIVSGEACPEEGLIRFVVSPEGRVAPDLARKLPGRGMWVAAERASLELAVKRRAFARAARRDLHVPADLADAVERLLLARLLSGLGLARKAGDLVAGFAKVEAALAAGRVAWRIEAVDGSAEGRRKLAAAARAGFARPPLAALFTAEELGLALGLENVIHTALLAGRTAERWGREAARLAGFRPLWPEAWREEGLDPEGRANTSLMGA